VAVHALPGATSPRRPIIEVDKERSGKAVSRAPFAFVAEAISSMGWGERCCLVQQLLLLARCFRVSEREILRDENEPPTARLSHCSRRPSS
jgi:hypothetical protein